MSSNVQEDHTEEVEDVIQVSAHQQFQTATQSVNMWKMTKEQRDAFYAQNGEIVRKMSEECESTRLARDAAEKKAYAERLQQEGTRKAAAREERRRDGKWGKK